MAGPFFTTWHINIYINSLLLNAVLLNFQRSLYIYIFGIFFSNGSAEMNNKMASYTTEQEVFIKSFYSLSGSCVAVERRRFVLHYRETLFLGLLNKLKKREVWVMNMCGTCHSNAFGLVSTKWCQPHIFDERVLSTRYPALFEEETSWPSISPDLNLCDYFLVLSVCYVNEDSSLSVSEVDRYLIVTYLLE
jgi:hypothetical protein